MYFRWVKRSYVWCCSRKVRNWIAWLVAGAWKLKRIRRNTDWGRRRLCWGEEDIKHMLLDCTETGKRIFKVKNGSVWMKSIIVLYRVSQEKWTKLRESVPYVELYRYNPKHLYPKLNVYGDNGHRKVWASGVSTYCTSTAVVHWPWQCNKRSHLCDCPRSAQRDKTVLHYGQIFMRNV